MPSGHYPRVGIARGPYRRTPISERYWRYVVVREGCWDWSGGRIGRGYGALQGEDRRVKTAHRVSWEIHRGPIPDGMNVLHRCDNPPCSNPDHLFLGSQRENVIDMVQKGRHGVPRGIASPAARVTDDIVRDMRRRYSPGRVTFRHLAEEYGVSISCVQEIVHRRRWTHVE